MRLRLFASSLALAGLLAACGGTAGDDDEQATAGAAKGGSAGTAKGGSAGQGAGAGGTTGSSGSGGVTGTAGSGGSPSAGSGGATAVDGGAGGARAGTRAGNGGAAGSVAGVAGSGAGMSAVDGGMAGFSFGGRTSMGGRRGMGMGGLADGGAGGLAFAGMSGMSSAGAGAGGCTGNGRITYTLAKSASPTSEEQNAYDLITAAMDKAIQYYDCYTSITKAESVTYVPSVSTADGNSNGSIRFGQDTYYMEYTTAMHEIAHTVGIGTASQWPGLVQNGIFTGAQATAQLRAITGVADDEVHADTQHFWPYGLNYQSEVKSEADVIDHCHMVVAIRADMGLQ